MNKRERIHQCTRCDNYDEKDKWCIHFQNHKYEPNKLIWCRYFKEVKK